MRKLDRANLNRELVKEYSEALRLLLDPWIQDINKKGTGHMYIPDKEYWEARRLVDLIDTTKDVSAQFREPRTFGYRTGGGFVALLPESEAEKEVFC